MLQGRADDSSPNWVAVIDDHPSLRTSLTRALEMYGIAAEAFASAEDYLRLGHQARPCCLVLDVQLPGMSGFELQSELAARETTPPSIIFISAHGDLLSHAVRKDPAGAYLQKPFEIEALVALVMPHVTRAQPPLHSGESIR